MNILVLGHKNHGKTTVGKMLADRLGVACRDSSTFALETIIYPALKDKYGYDTIDACVADKDFRRPEWYDLIEAYNRPPDRLTRDILDEANIYVGMRSRYEFEGSKHHFDVIVWVDASDRLPLENKASMRLVESDATYIIDNNGDEDNLVCEVEKLIEVAALSHHFK